MLESASSKGNANIKLSVAIHNITKMSKKDYKNEPTHNLLQVINKTFYSTIISSKINGLPDK